MKVVLALICMHMLTGAILFGAQPPLPPPAPLPKKVAFASDYTELEKRKKELEQELIIAHHELQLKETQRLILTGQVTLHAQEILSLQTHLQTTKTEANHLLYEKQRLENRFYNRVFDVSTSVAATFAGTIVLVTLYCKYCGECC